MADEKDRGMKMAKKDNTTAHNSGQYDLQINSTIPYYENLHAEALNVIKAAGIEPAMWLDTGCGTGTFVKKAYEQYPGAFFILADPSQEMMNQSKKKLDGIRGSFRFLPPVKTQDLRINDKCEVITAIQSHHYGDPAERVMAVKVAFNMLQKNGIFVTTENISPFSFEGISIGKKNWATFQEKSGRTAKEAQKHIERFGKEYFPINIEEHFKLYRETGFKAVEMFWYSYMQAGFYCIK
jgi:tRNA (cmo5U34)-methyltransferase